MKDRIKLFIVKCLRTILRIFYLIPVHNNRILFSSFEGRQYSDNPKYLYKYIKEKYADKYDYIWVLNDPRKNEEQLKIVRFLSIRHIYYLMTSKYIISNLGIEPFIPKRKSQVFLNTWHGTGAYKSETLGEKLKLSPYTKNMRDYRGKITDFYVSGCQRFADVYTEAWNAPIDKFLHTGTPRNDILFLQNLDEKRKEILEKLKLNQSNGYILFAPTFRGNSYRSHETLDINLNFEKLIFVCEKKFNKKFQVLYREHVGAIGDSHNTNSVIDVSEYPDMQELLLSADLFITDYSSCLWDFSVLRRPGFIFAPDLDEYLKERDFYTPIEEWPFKLARTNDELFELINNFSYTENNERITKHFNQLGSFENGKACEEIIKIMEI